MNKKLRGALVRANSLNSEQTAAMFSVMQQFYDDTDFDTFLMDLREKDFCILLFDESRAIRGFSTQMLIPVTVENETVQGIFSGDTIIHKDYWGGLELFRVFAQNLVPLGARHADFYWFLTSKGYKTYRMLPVFFNKFYPTFRNSTPEREQGIMHAFGRAKYPREYDETRGVIVYKRKTDKLKPGVADVHSVRRPDEDVRYFVEKNPGYRQGDDLVCLASLARGNFRPGVRGLLFRTD